MNWVDVHNESETTDEVDEEHNVLGFDRRNISIHDEKEAEEKTTMPHDRLRVSLQYYEVLERQLPKTQSTMISTDVR